MNPLDITDEGEQPTVFSCRDCIAGRDRGHGPVWVDSKAPLCLQMQARNLCGKKMLGQLIEEGKITVALLIEA